MSTRLHDSSYRTAVVVAGLVRMYRGTWSTNSLLSILLTLYHTHRNSWCDPFKTWQKAYSFNPTANLTEEESKFVLGGQHLLWAEQSNPHNLDPVVWPRAASSAELFWTGPGQNVSSALPRLHDLAFRMQQRGVGAISLQPLWCALRPGACDLTA